MELSSKQRKYLRSRAHELKPVVMLGKDGLSDGVVREVDEALAAHELIKVRLAGERDERRQQAEEMADACDAALAGVVGKVAILYRRHPEPSERRFALPS